jgi:hypothetical protein
LHYQLYIFRQPPADAHTEPDNNFANRTASFDAGYKKL